MRPLCASYFVPKINSNLSGKEKSSCTFGSIRKNKSLQTIDRASDNSREKNSNFAGFAETNSRRKRPISREFRVNFGSKFRRKAKKKEPRKNIYWKDVKFRARKKTQKFIQHSSEGNCTCFERQEKHKLKLYRNARPVNLLFQLQFRAEQSNAINFFSLLAVLCCFAAYKARLLVIECSNPFVKSKHPCVFDRALHERLNMCLRYYRQQFSFTLRIVSRKVFSFLVRQWEACYIVASAQFFATLI